MSQTLGFAAETAAKNYLMTQGLSLVVSNYRSRCGEIDLIMRDGECLVFVEVRSRASQNFGGALESITVSKQNKLRKTAEWYLLSHKLSDRCPCRFDALGLDGEPPIITWVKNAF